MNILIKFILLLIFFLGSTTIGLGQEALTTQQWQDDLRFLQKTVHNKYPFLFKKVTKEAWDAEVEEFYAAIPSLETHEIKVGLTRMVSFFEYGHTQVAFGTIAEKVLALNLYHFEDGIYVEGVQKGNEKALGAKVLKIGNMPVAEALKAVRPVVPAENDSYFKGYGLRFLTVPAVLHAQGITASLEKEVALTLEKNGQQFEHVFSAIPLSELSKNYGFTTPNEKWVSARDQSKTPLFLKHLNEKLYYFEYLEASKTLYVRQSSVFNDEKEPLADFYKRLFEFVDANEIDKFVYDIRLNGGGNNFNNKQLIQGIMARPKINTHGKFFFIIGRNTFSAAQNLTNEIENYTEAILVGEPTAENKNFYGDNTKETLPNSKINAYLSFAWWQDKAPWDKQEWTIPHMAKEMTFSEYVNNQDGVLGLAMNYTESDFVMDPMDHLTQLFIAGKFAEVKSEGARIAKDPAYKYFDFEKEFGDAGSRLVQSQNPESGLMILEMVADIYPESVGALFNLANSQEKLGQTENAKASYSKLIALSPESVLGKTAQKKLEKLNKK